MSEIREWQIVLTVRVRDGATEALETFMLADESGLAVDDDEREQLYAFKNQLSTAFFRIVTRRQARANARESQ